MREFKFTKQALKRLKQVAKSNPKIAQQLKNVTNQLRQDEITGEVLQGFSSFKKIRVSKYRLIYTLQEEVLIIAVIEKRDTVYQTFAHLLKNSDFLDI